MPTGRYCTFCHMSGVASPHDHFVRASRDQSSAVTCPRLLSTECSFCNRKGHTAKYCGERRDREYQARTAISNAKKTAFASGEWMVAKTPTKSIMRAAPVLMNTTSMFGALALDDSSDSEQDPEPIQTETEPTGPSWADVAKRSPFPLALEKRPAGMSWADWDEDDE